MPPEAHSTNHYAIPSEPIEAFGCKSCTADLPLYIDFRIDRRFESAQDFPEPPPFTNSHHQSTYQTLQPHGGDNWIDGFLQLPPEPDGFFEELPEMFVGMSTTLSPQQSDRVLAGATGYVNGTQSPFQVVAADTMSQVPRNTQYNLYAGLQSGNKHGDPNRGSFNGYENFEPLFGQSSITYDPNFAATQNNNPFFPTPPLSTYAPNFFDNTSFGSQAPSHRNVQTPRQLQFGSDARFEGQSFVAPPEQETPETVEKRKMNHLECLKPEDSPASTHPSSPAIPKKSRKAGPYTADYREPLIPITQEMDQDETIAETPEPKPRKRRKTNPDSDPDFEASRKPTRQASKRGKTSSAKKPPPPLAKTSQESSPSKSRSSDAKPNRQHLTEDQKKTNHIISEQKRRDLIKQGYDGIREMVPALKDVKYSKGAMLEAAADWLEDIVQCNQVLKNQLASLNRG